MRKSYFLIAVVLLIALIATPVFAQGQSYFHEITIELDGEWTLDSRFDITKVGPTDALGLVTLYPEVSSGVTLVGVGKARIHAITKAQSVPVWWDLF